MFKDIVKASRSYRGYDESYRFSREELEDFVDCARFAPSSVNAQPFRYYLAWEKEEVDRIQKLTNWARALPQMQLPHPGMCPTGFIIICQDLNLGASIPRYQKDVGIVAQTMLLAAAEKGLGGCMIGNYNADSVKKEFALLMQFEGDKKSRRHVLYRCTASRPNITSKTVEEQVQPQTTKVTITAMPLKSAKHITKASIDNTETNKAVYDAWFTAVKSPTFT